MRSTKLIIFPSLLIIFIFYGCSQYHLESSFEVNKEFESRINEKKVELASRISEENIPNVKRDIHTRIPILYLSKDEMAIIELETYICDVAYNYGGAIGSSSFEWGYLCTIKPSQNFLEDIWKLFRFKNVSLRNFLNDLDEDGRDRYVVNTDIPVLGQCFGSGENLISIQVADRICDRCNAVNMLGHPCSNGCYSCRKTNMNSLEIE